MVQPGRTEPSLYAWELLQCVPGPDDNVLPNDTNIGDSAVDLTIPHTSSEVAA